MKLVIAVVGSPRDAALAAAIAEYEARAVHYWPVQVVEVREGSAKGRSVDDTRSREAEHLRSALGSMAYWVCTEGGVDHTSAQFAQWLQRVREAARDVALCIGGAFGLDRTFIAGAEGKLALAPFTMPHELARLVLTEQVYRAGTIIRGEPYHK
jgi:23S rRNA (pseudouridine1915-N3)-methyltransferase